MHPERIEAKDPDPISIIALLVSSVSMLLNLERRIKDRQKAVGDQQRAYETTRIRIALMDISQAVERLQWFWNEYNLLGTLEIRSEEFRPGSASKYFTYEEYRQYAELLDDALRSISRLNRSLGEILFSEVGLSPEATQRIAEVLGRLRQRCSNVLSGQMTLKPALEAVQVILSEAQEFLRTAHYYFGREIDPPR